LKIDETLKPRMARLHQQFQEICRREATEQDLRNDLKTVWDNFSNKRRLDINVKFSRQMPTPPLMLMAPGVSDGPSVQAPSPPWTTPNSYFITLPTLPTDVMLAKNSQHSDEPPDDMIDRYFSFLPHYFLHAVDVASLQSITVKSV
jgi:hypothetical protein